MGCDIHVHGEVKINGVWRHWSNPNISRSYSLFARMANVRNDGSVEPIAGPRGVPEDATFETKFDCDRWDSDGHSHSWLSGEEVGALGEWYEAKNREWDPGKFYSFEMSAIGFLFGGGWDVKKYPQDEPAGVEDARLIFWFDN